MEEKKNLTGIVRAICISSLRGGGGKSAGSEKGIL